MKIKNVKLFLLIIAGAVWVNQAVAKEIKLYGTLKSSSTTTSGSTGTRTDSYTCSKSTDVCITITIAERDTTTVHFPYLPENIIEEGQLVTISAEGVENVTGRFVRYTNEPVPGEDITTRTHKFETIQEN